MSRPAAVAGVAALASLLPCCGIGSGLGSALGLGQGQRYPAYPQEPYVAVVNELGGHDIGPWHGETTAVVHVVVGRVASLRGLRFTLTHDDGLEVVGWEGLRDPEAGSETLVVHEPTRPAATELSFHLEVEGERALTVEDPTALVALTVRPLRDDRHFFDLRATGGREGTSPGQTERFRLETLPALVLGIRVKVL